MNTIIVANIIQLCKLCHYAMCNREEMKTLNCLYLTVMSSCFWQSVNEHSVMLFRAKISLTPRWRAENVGFVSSVKYLYRVGCK